jgi:hypothetical protein
MFMKKAIVHLQMPPVRAVISTQMVNHMDRLAVARITPVICRTLRPMELVMQPIRLRYMALQSTRVQMELLASRLLFTVTQMITNHSLPEIRVRVSLAA